MGITKNVLLLNFEFLKKIERKILDRFFKVFGLEYGSDFMNFENFAKFYKLFSEKSGGKNDYVEFVVRVNIFFYVYLGNFYLSSICVIKNFLTLYKNI